MIKEAIKGKTFNQFKSIVVQQLEPNQPLRIRNKDLFDKSGVAFRTYKKYLDQLQEEELIKVEPLDNRYSIITLLAPNKPLLVPINKPEDKCVSQSMEGDMEYLTKTIQFLTEKADYLEAKCDYLEYQLKSFKQG